MLLTVLTFAAALVGYQLGALVAEYRAWRLIRDHQDQTNAMLERLRHDKQEDVHDAA